MHDDILAEEKITIDPDFSDKVEYLFNGLDSLDYYSFLEIDKRETSDKIKRAYYQAAKKFHPDKHLHLPSNTFKKKLNTIFVHLTEIYKILSDPERRMQYDKNLSVQQAPMHRSNTDLAKFRFQEGKEALSKGAYAEARDLFGQAVYLDSSVAEYYFNLGLALVKTDKFREAVNIFNKAIKLDPTNSDYLAELGHVYLKLGLKLRAESTFEKAVKMDPFHAMAYNGLKRIRDSFQ
jgi:tetratricopeptide (TPR) repeat protein